jgi:hypothetical protein
LKSRSALFRELDEILARAHQHRDELARRFGHDPQTAPLDGESPA